MGNTPTVPQNVSIRLIGQPNVGKTTFVSTYLWAKEGIEEGGWCTTPTVYHEWSASIDMGNQVLALNFVEYGGCPTGELGFQFNPVYKPGVSNIVIAFVRTDLNCSQYVGMKNWQAFDNRKQTGGKIPPFKVLLETKSETKTGEAIAKPEQYNIGICPADLIVKHVDPTCEEDVKKAMGHILANYLVWRRAKEADRHSFAFERDLHAPDAAAATHPGPQNNNPGPAFLLHCVLQAYPHALHAKVQAAYNAAVDDGEDVMSIPALMSSTRLPVGLANRLACVLRPPPPGPGAGTRGGSGSSGNGSGSSGSSGSSDTGLIVIAKGKKATDEEVALCLKAFKGRGKVASEAFTLEELKEMVKKKEGK